MYKGREKMEEGGEFVEKLKEEVSVLINEGVKDGDEWVDGE